MQAAVFNPVLEQWYPADCPESFDWQTEIEEIDQEIEAVETDLGNNGCAIEAAEKLKKLQSRFDDFLSDYGHEITPTHIDLTQSAISSLLNFIEITDTIIDDHGRSQVVVIGYHNPNADNADTDGDDEF